MKLRELYTGSKPFSYVVFSYEDAAITEELLDFLEAGGYRFWMNSKITPSEKDLKEMIGRLRSANMAVFVLTKNFLDDRLIEDVVEYIIEKKTPILIYLTVETSEVMEYLNKILERARNAVVFRAWEQEFKTSSTVKQALSQTKGITEAEAAGFYEKGLEALRDENATSQSLTEGFKNISYAAANEYSPALDFLGNLALEKARNGRDSYSTAVAYYKAAMTLGNIDAIYSLGCLIADGEGFSQSYSAAEPFLSLAALRGIVDAQFRFAEMLDYGKGVARNRAEAAVWYKKALDGGDRRAYLPLAYRYLSGETVPRNENTAAQYFSEAASDGSTEAILMLAKLYRDGVGVRKDAAKSEVYFRKAAEKNIAEAQYCYALILRDKGNYTEAFKWLSLSAYPRKYGEEPAPEVLFEIGEMYMSGKGVEQDKQTAFMYYHKAALAGYEKARDAVAECYRKGIGVAVNKRAAAFYDVRHGISDAV